MTFKAIQLKYKLRTGVLNIGENTARQHRDNGLCINCGDFESVKHFVMFCRAYSDERQLMYRRIKEAVDERTFNMFISSPDYALTKLLGEHEDCFNHEILTFLSDAWVKRQQAL